MNNNNDNEFNAINRGSLNSVHELISTYGMEAMPQAMEILFNEAMLIERTQHLGAGHYQRSSNRLDYANGYKPKCLVPQSCGVSLPQLKETNLWETYCMLMPRLRHESELKYKTLQRQSLF
jgi:hypothetical protein